MTNPSGNDTPESGLHAEVAQPPYAQDVVEAMPDAGAGEGHHREAGRVVVEAAHVQAQAQVAAQPVDVSASTDPHRDNTSVTGQNDSSVSDSPVAAHEDAPVEAAADPVTETPPEEKHEEPPPEHHDDPAPEHHEPAAPDPAPSNTEGTEHHE